MNPFSLTFYILAALILAATAMAVTRRNLIHAVLYLILSFFGSALMFYLFGAPLLAMLEIIIYAGAIMILFLFIVMMLRVEETREPLFPAGQWVPAAVMAAGYLAVVFLIGGIESTRVHVLTPAVAVPKAFGLHLFKTHWLSIEIVSYLLLVALVGALFLGMNSGRREHNEEGDES
ncbi:MAG: NADH-quinone oxidoreductase subunit J [Desulfobacterales bacterium]|jgi:NADH-quinone oxidoreductase subunit J